MQRIIAIGGGKGGVGKSVISSNLAIAIAATGKTVTLVDLDLGSPNLHTLLGICDPGPGMQAFLDGDVSHLGDTAIRTATYGVHLIPGTAKVGSANLSHRSKQRLLDAIPTLSGDVVLLDLGAGTTLNTLDCFDLADVRVIVMTPQLTSVQNAYTFLKAAVQRSIHRSVDADVDRDVAAAELKRLAEVPRIQPLIEALRTRNPHLAARVAAMLSHYGCYIVGNMVANDADQRTFHRISKMIADFLLVPAPVAGALHDSAAVKESVNQRRPLLEDGGGINATELRRIAHHLLRADVRSLRAARHQELAGAAAGAA